MAPVLQERNVKQRVPWREEMKDKKLKEKTFSKRHFVLAELKELFVILAKESSKEKKSRGYDFINSTLQLQIETLRNP